MTHAIKRFIYILIMSYFCIVAIKLQLINKILYRVMSHCMQSKVLSESSLLNNRYFSNHIVNRYDTQYTKRAIMQFADNADPDQLVHLCRLIRAFVARSQNQRIL